MPTDEYTLFGGGALRLKGAKVKKPKKKKKDKTSDLEKALETGGTTEASSPSAAADAAAALVKRDGEDSDSTGKRSKKKSDRADGEPQGDDGHLLTSFKTEAQRRFEEARRKKLLGLSESAAARPELLKTHKERVEELNTYLSKLSEHHDMPKIGPG